LLTMSMGLSGLLGASLATLTLEWFSKWLIGVHCAF
jgi:hypothetical protein